MTLEQLLNAIIDLDRDMANMESDTDYDSEYQSKNREWQRLYDAIIDVA